MYSFSETGRFSFRYKIRLSAELKCWLYRYAACQYWTKEKIHQATVGFTPINYSDRGLFPFSQDMISMTILTTMMVTIKKY